MRGYDFIVIGVGGMGSAALYHLARRGHRVLGLERFIVGHDRGSSHGETRIIRKAYFEHPDYVPLLQRAYALWDELAEESGEELLVRCGMLLCGAPPPAGRDLVGDARRAARAHGVPIEEVAPPELPRRFPGFALEEGMEAIFEPEAGFLRVEDCVRAHVAQALARGVERVTIHEGEQVRAIVPAAASGGAALVVETDRGRYEAGGVVVCGGAFSAPLLAELALPLQVRRKILLWYGVAPPAYALSGGCPVFGFDNAAGFFYGFPVLPQGGGFHVLPEAQGCLKVACHSGGEEVADPAALDRSLRPEDEAPVRAFLRRHLPAAAEAPLRHHAACMYTMTPDEHFVIDRHPAVPALCYAAGFSGHGFKFASVVGEALADLATEGRSALPIGFLSAARLSQAAASGLGVVAGDGEA